MGFLRMVAVLGLFITIGACSDAATMTPAPRDVVRPIIATAYLKSDPLEVRQYASGSVVIIAPGYALTANHVVTAGRDMVSQHTNIGVFLKLQRADGELINVTVVKTDDKTDLALVRGDFPCPCASLHSGTISVDTKVITVGFPLYGKYKIQILSEGSYQGMSADKLVTTAQAAPGSSGGGVFAWTSNGYKLLSIVEGIGASSGDVQANMHSWLVFSTPTTVIKQFLIGTELEHLGNH